MENREWVMIFSEVSNNELGTCTKWFYKQDWLPNTIAGNAKKKYN